MDSSALYARVPRWRLRTLIVATAVAAIVLASSVNRWLDRWAGTSGVTFPLDVLFNVALIGLLVWIAWARWRDVREATSPRYLTHFYRQDLADRIRSARRRIWTTAPICLLAIFRPLGPASIVEGVATRLLFGAALGAVVWERFVELPRLEREEQLLPFFDDFPHLF